MKHTQLPFILVVGLGLMLLPSGCGESETETPEVPEEEAAAETESPAVEALPFSSVTALTFADEETLLIADSVTGRVHSVAVPAPDEEDADGEESASEGVESEGESEIEGDAPAGNAPPPGFALRDVDVGIAELLGTTPRSIRVRDLAIHPATGEAYLAVSRAGADEYASAVVVANMAGGMRLLEVPDDAPSLEVPSAAGEGFAFYDEVSSRELTFTDLLVHDGTLYIAGLSHDEFASTLWSTPLPLGETVHTSTVEIFHTIHNQQETRAPIRTMAVLDIGGSPHMVAAYTCTPLVVFPMEAIEDGAHIAGKTIAEMGFGNTPSELLVFTTQDAQQQPMDVLFLQNVDRAAQVIPLGAVQAAAQGDGLTEMVALQDQADLGAGTMPMASVLEVADQDPVHLAVLRRDPQEGDLELVSFMKGVYFRLSDFQSEYEIPGYEYAEAQIPIRQFQNLMKLDEGYPQHVRQ